MWGGRTAGQVYAITFASVILVSSYIMPLRNCCDFPFTTLMKFSVQEFVTFFCAYASCMKMLLTFFFLGALHKLSIHCLVLRFIVFLFHCVRSFLRSLLDCWLAWQRSLNWGKTGRTFTLPVCLSLSIRLFVCKFILVLTFIDIYLPNPLSMSVCQRESNTRSQTTW